MNAADVFDLCLRHDLEVVRLGGDKDGRYRVVLPETQEAFEFGAEEMFLFRALDGSTPAGEVCARFAERFGMALALDDLDGFCGQMEAYGLLVPCDEVRERVAEGVSDTGDDVGAVPGIAEDSRDDAISRTAMRAGRGREDRYRYSLFNPDRVFTRLARILRPLRYLRWLLVPGVPAAFMLLLQHQAAYVEQMRGMFAPGDWMGMAFRFLLGLFAVNLTSKLLQGIVTLHYGGAVERLGIRMAFGVRPRFYVNKRSIWNLHREGRLWAFGTPLLVRLGIFVAGTFFWFFTAGRGNELGALSLLLGQIGLWAFLFTANPLWRADGYAWLITYLNLPRLRERAFKLLGMRLTGRPAPAAMSGAERRGLLAYAVASATFVAALVAVVLFFVGMALEERFHGTGVVLFLVLLALVVRWALYRFGARGGASAAAPKRRGRSAGSRALSALKWGLFLASLALLGSLPYPFHVGGEATVFPVLRGEARARSSGEVVQVLVDEGDAVVRGTVIAALEDWDQTHQLALTEESLAKARAELALLEHGPKSEQVALSQQQVDAARTRAKHSEEQRRMLYPGYKDGSVPALDYERAVGTAAVDRANVAVARAQLALTEAGPLEMELESQRAEVRRLERQVAYQRDTLERTRIRAPLAGRVVSPRPQQKLGNFLREGDLFSVIEDNRTAEVEIRIPETDVGEVRTDAAVELRVWSDPGRSYRGRVTAIAPTAEEVPESPFVRIVRVTTAIDNGDGSLRSETTGYAKVSAGEKPVAVAFSRALVRFFVIELWSWLP